MKNGQVYVNRPVHNRALLLTVFSSTHKVCPDRVGKYAEETRKFLASKYLWKVFSQTVHKLILDGPAFVDYFKGLIEFYSEEAGPRSKEHGLHII